MIYTINAYNKTIMSSRNILQCNLTFQKNNDAKKLMSKVENYTMHQPFNLFSAYHNTNNQGHIRTSRDFSEGGGFLILANQTSKQYPKTFLRWEYFEKNLYTQLFQCTRGKQNQFIFTSKMRNNDNWYR